MATAQTFTWIHGTFEGPAMSDATIGGVLGMALGFIAGVWLVLRREGKWAGTALTCLGIGALFMVGCLGFVAFS